MSDTNLDPASLTAEERAIVDHEASRFHRDWAASARYQAAMNLCEPIILARRATFAPKEEGIGSDEGEGDGMTTNRDELLRVIGMREAAEIASATAREKEIEEYRAGRSNTFLLIAAQENKIDELNAEIASLRAKLEKVPVADIQRVIERSTWPAIDAMTHSAIDAVYRWLAELGK